MNLAGALVLVAAGFVLWSSRRSPLAGWRKRLVIACRLAAVAGVGTALLGLTHRHAQELARQVVYLVDVSASIDPSRREWIAKRIASLESVRPERAERAVVAFGAETQLVVPLGREPLRDPEAIRRALDETVVARDGTNVEAALLAVPGLMSSPARGRVVLLSDGRETRGNVTGVLAAVRRLGLEVFPVPVPTFGESKTSWEEIAVPAVVQRGASVPVHLVVVGGAARSKSAQVTILLQGVAIKRQRLTVRPGWQVARVDVPAMGHGTMALEIQLAIPEEGISETRRAYTEVEGPPQVLLVGERLAALPALGLALKRREMELAVAQAPDVPTDASRLLDYDAVILFNVPKSSLEAPQVAALRTYLEDFGGGLVMVGLGGDLAIETTTPAPLDALLPLQFEPKGLQEAKRRVCMILLIDRSASMLGPRIAATKRAAVELVKQLAPEDLVGVLAFDTKAYVVAEVQPARQLGPRLIEKLVTLRSSGGTDVLPALTAAASRLELTGATVKHIILLSDGNTPFHEDAYRALVDSFHLSGTTVSTIGIGSVFINTDYLEWLAGSTGGSFYLLRDLNELPRLVVRDTERALERLPFTEGYFRPAKTDTTDWFVETAQWPPLRGYLTATAKPLARVDLTVRGGSGDPLAGGADEPLLARWGLGQGRVAAFASDADVRWSPDWIRWEGFERTWAQVVRWAMRPRFTEALFVWMDESRDIPQLVIEGALQDPAAELIAADGAAAVPLALVQTGPWRWHASLEQLPSGWYQLALESHHPATIFARRWVQIGAAPSVAEIPGQPSREGLLRQIARATGGAYDTPDGAFLPPTAQVSVIEPLFVWWLPLVIVLLLVEIFLRGSTML